MFSVVTWQALSLRVTARGFDNVIFMKKYTFSGAKIPKNGNHFSDSIISFSADALNSIPVGQATCAYAK